MLCASEKRATSISLVLPCFEVLALSFLPVHYRKTTSKKVRTAQISLPIRRFGHLRKGNYVRASSENNPFSKLDQIVRKMARPTGVEPVTS